MSLHIVWAQVGKSYSIELCYVFEIPIMFPNWEIKTRFFSLLVIGVQCSLSGKCDDMYERQALYAYAMVRSSSLNCTVLNFAFRIDFVAQRTMNFFRTITDVAKRPKNRCLIKKKYLLISLTCPPKRFAISEILNSLCSSVLAYNRLCRK